MIETQTLVDWRQDNRGFGRRLTLKTTNSQEARWATGATSRKGRGPDRLLLPGMVVPQSRGAFRFRALLYCAKAALAWGDQCVYGAGLKICKERSGGKTVGKEVSPSTWLREASKSRPCL